MYEKKTGLFFGIKVIIEKKHIKNMYLRLSLKEKAIKVSCPYYFSDKRINDFIKEKEDWIKEKGKLLASEEEKTFTDGNTVLFFGEEYKLILKESDEMSSVRIENGCVIMTLSCEKSEKEKRELYEKFLKKNFEKILPSLTEHCEKITGLHANSYKIRKMETRWGSCTVGKKDIRLSLKLAYKDFECIEYVILHELTHLIYHGHGKDFYSQLEIFCPQMKEIEKKLK